MQPGEQISFQEDELNAWLRERAPTGVREPKIELGNGTAMGAALVDLSKLRAAERSSLGNLLLAGGRAISVAARFESSQGQGKVDLTRVEIDGVPLTGTVLELLIRGIFLPMFPNAHLGESFELREPIERIEIRPGAVYVVARR